MPKRAATRPALSDSLAIHRIDSVEFQGKADVITAALRELIITGEVEAGTPLRQRDLAARFGVSPTPVREALRRLEAEGLVEHDLHRGATVIDAHLGSSEEGYHVRAALESLAARIAAQRAEPHDIEEIRALHEQFAALAKDDPSLNDLNRRFHFRIYEASRSPMLLALLRLLWQSFRQGPLITRPLPLSVEQHGAIVEALAAGDSEATERLMRDHILSAVGS